MTEGYGSLLFVPDKPPCTVEMVNRVAKAIVDHFEGGAAYIGITVDLTCVSINGVEMDILALAKVAIEAMREPTEAMIDAALREPE